MIPFLPPEIIQNIFEQLKQRKRLFSHSYDEISSQELARCCLTSKSFLSAAQPLLYKIIKVNLLIATNIASPEPQFHVPRRESLLLRTLKENDNRHLQDRIEQVHIQGVEGGEWSVINDGDDPGEVIGPLVIDAPRLQIVEVRSLAQYPEVDYALRWAQTEQRKGASRNSVAPLFRQVATEPAWEGIENGFTTIYEGYKYAFWWPYKAWMWDRMLTASHDTLSCLSITLDPGTALSNFHHLERLSLQLSETQPDSTLPEDVDMDLLRLLPTLSNLRFLVLSPYIFESELSSLLQNDDFAHSLPSTITHLSLELCPSSVDVLAFIKNLPEESGLTRFNYAGETGKEGEIAEACKVRGIKLSLNEEWEIRW